MTPTKEKAIEIYERFKEEFELYGIGNVWVKKSAKKHTLICVDEQIKSLKKYEQFETFELYKELLEVKNHIEKL